MAALDTVRLDRGSAHRSAAFARLGILARPRMDCDCRVRRAGRDLLPIADPSKISLLHRRQPPSAMYLLGTDHLGRDVLARVVYASRSSLTVGLVSAFLGLLVGGTLGLLAGYFRGRFESLTMASVDVLLAFPPLVLALAIIAYLGQSLVVLTLTLALLSVPAATRVARATTLAIAEREFVVAARALAPLTCASCCASCCPTWRCR
jgi:peptide/nickel transport system permease protein